MNIKLRSDEKTYFSPLEKIFFYLDNENEPHLNTNALPTKTMVNSHMFKCESDKLEDLIKAFNESDVASKVHKEDKVLLDHLFKTGKNPFIKVKIGGVKKAVFKELRNIKQSLILLKQLNFAGVRIDWEDFYTTVLNEKSFQAIFNTKLPTSDVIQFNLESIRSFSRFLLAEVNNANLSYVQLCILKEFFDSNDSVLEFVNQVSTPEQQADLAAGRAKIDNAVLNMKQFALFDMLHDVIDDIEDIDYTFNTYKSILSKNEFIRIMNKFSCVEIEYDKSFETQVTNIATNIPVSLTYVRSFYNYIRHCFRNETITEKTGFLGAIVSINSEYLSNLVSPEFMTTVIGSFTKNYCEANKHQFEEAAAYIDKIIITIDNYYANYMSHSSEDYKRLYARVTVLCNLVMSILHYGSKVNLEAQSDLQLQLPAISYSSGNQSDILPKVRQKISTSEGFSKLLATLNINKETFSDDFYHNQLLTKKWLKIIGEVSQTHSISPVTSLLLYGDVSPETMARINAMYSCSPALTALLLDEVFFKENIDNINTHPVYKFILDKDFLSGYTTELRTDNYESWASTTHLFLQMPELWVVIVLVNLFGTAATYEYLEIPEFSIDQTEESLKKDFISITDRMLKAPVLDYAVYFEPLTSFYKTNFNVWSDPETFREAVKTIAPKQITAV